MRMNFRKWSAAAGLAVGLLAFSSGTSAFAQCGEKCPDLGPRQCPGESKTQLEAAGYTLEVESLTDGWFNIIACTPPPPGCPGPWYADLDLVSFEGHGYDPTFGNFRWRNDDTRPISPASQFRSNDPASQFPASGYITFYAVAEIDGIPGVFRSVDPVYISSTNVNSFAPFQGELFEKDPNSPDVQFINDCDSDKIITLKSLSSVLGER